MAERILHHTERVMQLGRNQAERQKLYKEHYGYAYNSEKVRADIIAILEEAGRDDLAVAVRLHRGWLQGKEGHPPNPRFVKRQKILANERARERIKAGEASAEDAYEQAAKELRDSGFKGVTANAVKEAKRPPKVRKKKNK